METPTTQKEHTEEDVLKAFLSIEASILINLYTNENVVLGRIKPNDKIPTEQYLENLGFCNVDGIFDDLFLDGRNVENGYVTERTFEERCFELYKDKVDCIFDKVSIDKSFDNDNDDIYHYKHGWYEYLKDLYTLFEEIIKTEVTPDLFTSVPEQSYYVSASKFVLAIKTKGLRQGRRIDRYIKKMNFISPFLQRLIKKQKAHFYLKNSDINCLDYKLALLSCFRFMNDNNAKLFELKTLQWEENRA